MVQDQDYLNLTRFTLFVSDVSERFSSVEKHVDTEHVQKLKLRNQNCEDT